MGRRGNGEGTITKRDDGSYAVALSNGTDANGKRVRYQATCKTKKDAVAKLHEWKAARDQGLDIGRAGMTVSELIDVWLTNCRPRLRQTTLFSYEQLVRLHLKPTLGEMKVTQVTAVVLDTFFAQKRASGLGSSTIGYLRRLLHAIFEQAMDYDIVLRNVVERTAAIEESKFEAKYLTEAQAQALVSVLPSTDYGLFTLLCVMLGMRPGEVRGLRWADVSLRIEEGVVGGGTVEVRQQIKDKRGEGGGYLVQPPKTKKGARTIPLPASVARKLFEHRQRKEALHLQESLVVLESPATSEWADLVFRGEEGRPLAERYIRRKFKEFLQAAGLDADIRLYDMRHTNSTLLGAMGTQAEVRRDLLGHSTTQMTQDVYSHAMPRAMVEAMGKLDDLFKIE